MVAYLVIKSHLSWEVSCFDCCLLLWETYFYRVQKDSISLVILDFH